VLIILRAVCVNNTLFYASLILMQALEITTQSEQEVLTSEVARKEEIVNRMKHKQSNLDERNSQLEDKVCEKVSFCVHYGDFPNKLLRFSISLKILIHLFAFLFRFIHFSCLYLVGVVFMFGFWSFYGHILEANSS